MQIRFNTNQCHYIVAKLTEPAVEKEWSSSTDDRLAKTEKQNTDARVKQYFAAVQQHIGT